MQVDQAINSVEGHELGDITLAKSCADKLNEHYPGHLWAVHLNDESLGGVVVIRNMAVSGNHGYILKIDRIYNDPSLKCVIHAGGEILERARMSRAKWNEIFPEAVDGVN